MKSKLWTLCLLVLAPGGTCLAATMYTATLSGANEEPTPTASTATGYGTVILNGNLLTVDESYSGLTGSPTGAHIHCCSSVTATSPVEVPFTAFPTGTSGTYNFTYDLSTLSYTAGFTEAELIAGLNDGMAYLNIHSAMYPSGEIRGQLTPLSAVPEPGSFVLFGTGLLTVAGAVRRRIQL